MKSVIKSQGRLLNSEYPKAVWLEKGSPKSQAVWSSKALLQFEMMFLSADFSIKKKKGRFFSFPPLSVQDRFQSVRNKTELYSPSVSGNKELCTRSI